jgi:3-hydroxypropanoate dehydrogenase
MKKRIDDAGLDLLFRDARTYNDFEPTPIDDDILKTIAELTELGPTEANSLPGRFVFVKSPEAKATLLPLMGEGNRAKTAAAPVNIIAGYDMAFYDQLPKTFPHADARSWYVNAPEEHLQFSALRSASLQVGYLTAAARALGLGVGPMAGFDAAGIDAAFFPGTKVKTFMVINLGYGTTNNLWPRLPRLAFDDFASIA